jgi:hypothetical protein
MPVPIPTGTMRSLAALSVFIALVRSTLGDLQRRDEDGLPSVRKTTTRVAPARDPLHVGQIISSLTIFIAFPVHVHPSLYAMFPIAVLSVDAVLCASRCQLSSACVLKVITPIWTTLGEMSKFAATACINTRLLS